MTDRAPTPGPGTNRVQKDGLHLVRLREGKQDRHPVVMLHGFMGSSGDFADLGTDLSARTGRTVAAVDLPGHGFSVSLPDAAYSFDGATSAIRDAIFESGLAPAVLVGYSMGGRLAMAAACRAPDLVSALAVESGHPGLEDPEARSGRIEADAATAMRLVRDWPDFLTTWYRQSVFAGTPASLVSDWFERRRSNDREELARALDGLSTGRQNPLTERVLGLNRPMIFLAGERDRKYVEIGRSLAARSERTMLCVVEGAGHNVHAERPEAYLRALETFLEPID